MKKIRLLFQGDSITDAGRNYEEPHDLGAGYPKYAARLIKEKYPDAEIEFLDLGISGNQTKDLVERLDKDFVQIKPDMVSILIGINDVWHYNRDGKTLENRVFEERYRTVLEAVKATGAKIMMMEPFHVPVAETEYLREDLSVKIEVVRKLAREYADVYLPTDGLLNSAVIGEEPSSFSGDGVHLSEKGAEYVGKLYADYAAPILDELLS